MPEATITLDGLATWPGAPRHTWTSTWQPEANNWPSASVPYGHLQHPLTSFAVCRIHSAPCSFTGLDLTPLHYEVPLHGHLAISVANAAPLIAQKRAAYLAEQEILRLLASMRASTNHLLPHRRNAHLRG